MHHVCRRRTGGRDASGACLISSAAGGVRCYVPHLAVNQPTIGFSLGEYYRAGLVACLETPSDSSESSGALWRANNLVMSAL